MSSDFKSQKLREVIELVIDNRGKNPKEYSSTGIPVIDNYLITSDGQVNLDEVNRFIDENTYNSFLRKYIQHGDVLMTLVGNGYGKVAITPKEKCAIIQNTVGFRCNNDNSYKFLYYLLRNNREIFMNLNRGAAQPSIKVSDILELEFQFPSKTNQKDISSILVALDDRIAILRETNATLEAIAQALFKSWFVDFDPVRAKMEGRIPDGMDEATAAIFPDSFEESELGLVPRGWRVLPIGEAVEAVGGATPDTKTPFYWEPAIHCWTTPKDLSGIAAPVLLDTERKLSDQGLAKIGSGVLPIGTLLLSSRAPIGYLALAQVPLAINQGYIAIPPGGLLPPLYMLFWCRMNMDHIKGRANQCTELKRSMVSIR